MSTTYSQENLKDIALKCGGRIENSELNKDYFLEPFKHLVIDDFLPSELANISHDHFPSADEPIWERTNDEDIEVKLRSNWQSEFDVPEAILNVVRVLNSSILLKAMSGRFEIPKLICDPYFTGGGLNMTVRGGLLDVHVDGNYHDATGLNRRINAILYLNKGWQGDWGGEFGLYDATGDNLVKKVAPLFNRLVVFDTHDYSFHGLPNPLNFPDSEARKSVILYYYTKDPRPTDQIAVENPHSALWKKRNIKDKRGNQTRDYT